MNQPITIPMEDELVHTQEHPFCDDLTCPCHTQEEESMLAASRVTEEDEPETRPPFFLFARLMSKLLAMASTGWRSWMGFGAALGVLFHHGMTRRIEKRLSKNIDKVRPRDDN
jgi:hypothetical protein